MTLQITKTDVSKLGNRRVHFTSDSGRPYAIGFDEKKQRLFCSCPGYTFHGTCKHLDAFLAQGLNTLLGALRAR